MQKQSLTQIAFLIFLFCVTGGLLSSGALALAGEKQLWILCTSMLIVTCQLFVVGEGSRVRDGRWQLAVLAVFSAAIPFILGFVTILSTRDGALKVGYGAVAIVFVLSLGWPAYTVFRLAKGLRFHGALNEEESASHLQHIRALLTRLASTASLPKAQAQQLQPLLRRVIAAARLDNGPRSRVLASVIDSLRGITGVHHIIASDPIVLAYGRQKNLGLVDQLIAASAFISVVVSVGNWSRIPFAVSISRFRVLTFVVDLRLLVIAVLAASLASVAVAYVSRTPRPVPPKINARQIARPHLVGAPGFLKGLAHGLHDATINAANALLQMITGLLNGVVHFFFTLGALLSRVFRQMARLIMESVTKAGTWKLTLYICITFFGFLVLGVILGAMGDAIIKVVTVESGLIALNVDGLVRYLWPLAFFVACTMVLVFTSFLLNLLFDRETHWTEVQLSDLLLGFVPVAVSLPIAGFVLWVIARVFPAAALHGFETVGLITSLGVLLVLGYAMVIAYDSFGRRRNT